MAFEDVQNEMAALRAAVEAENVQAQNYRTEIDSKFAALNQQIADLQNAPAELMTQLQETRELVMGIIPDPAPAEEPAPVEPVAEEPAPAEPVPGEPIAETPTTEPTPVEPVGGTTPDSPVQEPAPEVMDQAAEEGSPVDPPAV